MKSTQKIVKTCLILLILHSIPYAAYSASPTSLTVAPPLEDDTYKPRIIATTDGEIDDRCSMVRFLLYANEWDIEGIIYCSSKFHWKGHNWAGEEWIENDIDLYASFYENLKKHDPSYPSPEELKNLVYIGNIDNVGAMKKDTPGSDRIVDILLDDKPGPVYLQAWGGTNTIARALWKIQHEHPDQMEKVSKKAIIYIILDQDKTFREYIQPNWPNLRVLGSFRQFAVVAYQWERIIPSDLHSFYNGDWMKENILHNHGPLCARYEARGDGSFRSEGDSPAFMHQIRVGLGSLAHPSYGGWGGRFVREEGTNNVWKGAKDDGSWSKPLWRWSEAFQNDWAARADWCVKPYNQANHNPIPVVNGVKGKRILKIKAKPGEAIKLNADGSTDPDGNNLNYKWWYYAGPSTYTDEVEIENANQKSAIFHVPYDRKDNEFHIILTVRDNGAPNLFAYRRVIVQSSAVVDDTKPSKPTKLEAKPENESQVHMQWQKSKDAESGIRHYQIYRNGKLIQKTDSISFIDKGLQESTTYTYHIAAVNGCLMESGKSQPAKVKTHPDTRPPQIQSVVGSGKTVYVLFDEPVDQTTAQKTGNYSIDHNVKITKASISDNHRAVNLTTSNLKDGQTYSLSVKGIHDKAKKPNTIKSNSHKSFVYLARKPIVKVGANAGESPITLNGEIERKKDGSLFLAEGEPWKWITVGEDQQPLKALEGLQSFTILGWAHATSLETGSGGNRLLFNLNYNRSGFDLVHLSDGRMRLAVNEWPDGVSNDSASNKIQTGKWVFFAVTYNASSSNNNVHWYFGDKNTPAQLDRTTNYVNGPTGKNSGPLTVGNYNKTIQKHGKDRQFRGYLKEITIFGSKTNADGVLKLDEIRSYQNQLE